MIELSSLFVLALLWSHVTILIFLIYQHLWKSYLNTTMGEKPNTEKKEDGEVKIGKKKEEKVNKEKEEEKGQNKGKEKEEKENNSELSGGPGDYLNTINEHVKNYLNALGEDYFGKKIGIDFMDTNNKGKGDLIYLTNNEISSMSPVQLHKYLLKLISYKGDYYIFKFNLPENLTWKVTKEITNKDEMIKFIINVRDLSSELDKEKEKESFNTILNGDMFTAMLSPMMQQFGNQKKVNSFSDTPEIKEEELTELEKEMKMITE